MDGIETPRPFSFRVGPLGAAITVLFGLIALYCFFSGNAGPSDWAGYQRLWDQEGGYLAAGGRDPLFVWLLRAAKVVFGSNGYEAFRATLFAMMAMVAAIITYQFPTKNVTVITTSLSGLAIWGIKSVVQIREGVALVFIASAFVLSFRFYKSSWWILLLGCSIACLIHLGTSPFLIAVVSAIFLSIGPSWALNGRWPQRFYLFIGFVLGGAVAWFCISNVRLVELSLTDMTEDTKVQALSGIWKSTYWIGQGLIVLALRDQLIYASMNMGKAIYATGTVIASVVMPAIYFVCAVFVLTNYYLPAATAFGGRLLFTVQTVALLLIGIRGRGNLITLGISVLLVAVQIRQLLTTSGW